MKSVFLTCLLVAFFVTMSSFAADSTSVNLGSELKKGLHNGQYVILLRHALAPGMGDPDSFDVKDCTTQRNLSDQGRQQAKRVGKLLKGNGIEKATVFSSQWCRCLDTARLLDLGNVTELEIINSLFQNSERKPQQTRELARWLANSENLDQEGGKFPIILVTHQVNITALTDVFPRSGELVIVEANESGSVDVIKRLETR